MTQADITKKIGKKVKVAFKPNDRRFPMIGVFVNCPDSEDLLSKGMIRFINQSRMDFVKDWSSPEIGLTRIYKITDFNFIQLING